MVEQMERKCLMSHNEPVSLSLALSLSSLSLLSLSHEFKFNGAFPLHGTVRFGTARYGPAQFRSVCVSTAV